jgi:hypothetical protein
LKGRPPLVFSSLFYHPRHINYLVTQEEAIRDCRRLYDASPGLESFSTAAIERELKGLNETDKR